MASLSKKSLKCPNCGANVASDCVRCDYCRSVLTLTACPSCFGAVFKGMKFCPGCGAAVERSEVKSDKKMPCPRCEKILAPADIANTRIHECRSCGGFWLDTESFRKICADQEQREKFMIYPSLIKNVELQPVLKANRFYIPCPECGSLMNQKNFAGCSGIVVDLCKPHGIWFDRLELQKIIHFIKDGGLHKARENELANLKAEQDRLQNMQFDQNLSSASLHERESFLDLPDDDSLLGIIFSLCKKLLF